MMSRNRIAASCGTVCLLLGGGLILFCAAFPLRDYWALAIILLALLTTVACWLMLRVVRSASSPPALLVECVERVAQGEFDAFDKQQCPDDESGPLYAALQTMAAKLEQQYRALQSEQEQWRHIFNAVDDPVCIIDNQFRITRSNRAMQALLKLNEAQLGGKACYELLHGSSHPALTCPHCLAVKDRAMHQTELYEPTLERWLRISAFPLLNQQQRLTGSVHIMRDITAERQAGDCLAQAARATQTANDKKNRVLAVLSHEIRTPLNGISGMVQLLRDSIMEPSQREFLNGIEISADSLLTVINDILDFSKIEAGQLLLVDAPFSPVKLCNDLLRVLRLRAQARGLQFSIALAPGMPELLVGDQGRLRQILNNLATNAIKFTHGGEITIQLSAEQRDDDLLLTGQVRDTGIGMSPETQAVIFDPFVQVENNTARSYGGTGLGLSICKQLAELMGGSIGVESAPGHGSTFTFTVRLKRAAAPVAAIQVSPQPEVIPQIHDQALQVLVAEDQLINQKFLQEILQRRGYTALLAANGQEALEIWERQPVDMVLMDIQMPVMDGLQALAGIRAREDGTGRHTPVVAVTAHAISGDKERLLEAGFDGYLPKPVQIAALFTEMARALEAIAKEKEV